MSTRPPEIPQLDLREVEALQSELLELVEQLNRDPDRDRQQQTVRRINECSGRLREVCDELERRARAISIDKRGTFDVELTADQRVELKRRTGLDRSIVTVQDEGGGLMIAMPTMTRDEIFELALAEAESEVKREQARVAARAELDRVRAELRQAPEQVRAELERLLADPEFRRGFEAPPDKR